MRKTIMHLWPEIIGALAAGLLCLSIGYAGSQGRLWMPFGLGASVVMSGSMEPELSVDDLVFIQRQDDYHVDDVVVYQAETCLVIHRIVEKSEFGKVFVTKGDANTVCDDPIQWDQIQGKMIGIVPGAGVWIRWIKGPVGYLMLLLLLIPWSEIDWKRDRKNKDLDALKRELKKEMKRLEELL